MSQETFQQITSLNITSLESQLALQCSPVISGLKSSNLLIVGREYKRHIQRLLQHGRISFFLLLETEHKLTYLLYREEVLIRFLATEKVRKLLTEFGCQDTTLHKLLSALQTRYKAYKNGQRSFPHEIGLILGYPPEDVIGFIENKGKNYLCVGYWKVYDNLSEKQRLFKAYEHARENIIHMLSCGICMREVIKKYNKKICATQ